jgi:ankyrin repeat protein
VNPGIVLLCLLLLPALVGCDRQKAKSELASQGIEATDRELLNAAQNGDNKTVELLLRAGRPVNGAEKYSGRTPLINAAENGHVEVVRTLLAAKADPNFPIVPKVFRSGLPLPGWGSSSVRPNPGWTPLMFAASKGHADVVKLLLQSGANVDSQGEPNPSQGFNNATPLMLACEAGHAEIAKMLLDAGAEMKVSDLMGRTPLFVASDLETLKVMQAAGADLRATDPEGNSLLRTAVGNVDIPRIEFLIGQGLDVNARNKKGTPLIFSSYGKATELLVKAGADINAKDAAGKTLVMHRAADGRFSGTVMHLQKLGASLEGLTPWQAMYALVAAAGAGDIEAAKAAITAGADVNATPNHGPNALFTAIRNDANLTMIQLLVDSGADVRLASSVGMTPLHEAAIRGRPDVIRLLLKAGADANARTKNEKTPLDFAIEFKRTDAVEVLRLVTTQP